MIGNGNDANANQMQQPQLVQISAKEFQAKFKAKREIYTWLTNECEAYLPPYGAYMSVAFLTFLFFQTTSTCTS